MIYPKNGSIVMIFGYDARSACMCYTSKKIMGAAIVSILHIIQSDNNLALHEYSYRMTKDRGYQWHKQPYIIFLNSGKASHSLEYDVDLGPYDVHFQEDAAANFARMRVYSALIEITKPGVKSTLPSTPITKKVNERRVCAGLEELPAGIAIHPTIGEIKEWLNGLDPIAL